MPLEIRIDTLRFRLILKRLFARKATAGVALGFVFAVSVPHITVGQEQYPPPPDGQYQYPPPPAQYPNPPAPPDGQYQYPPPQAQYPYPPPQAQYPYPPPNDAQPAFPVAPPGATWVGEPGECLYANGAVYWCAPGVIFTGLPAGWDYARYPVVSIAPGIVLDPIWFGGWRRDHPGFVFRGRIATDFERRAFFDHRVEIRNRAIRAGNPPGRERERQPEDRR
jgi:hypothetical protein